MQPERITPAEMQKGSEPTRQEKIYGTALEAVLAKKTWDDVDVEILVLHQHMLDDETLEKLGVSEPVAMTPEQVEQQTAKLKQQGVQEAAAKRMEAAKAQVAAAPEVVETTEETPVETTEEVEEVTEEETVDNPTA